MSQRLIVSNSMLYALCECSTLAALRTQHLRPRGLAGHPNTPAEAGKAAHEAFELWLHGLPLNTVLSALQPYKAFSERYVLSKDRLYHENIERVLETVFSQNPIQSMPWEVVDVKRGTMTEKQITAELAPGILMSDKSDGIVRMKATGRLMAMELKTVNYIGEEGIGKYALDSQLSTHTWVSRENGIDVDGVILFVIQFNKLPAPEMRKCKDHHIPQRDCWSAHVKWITHDFQRSPEQLELWKTNTLRLCHRYHDVLVEAQKGNWDAVPMEGPYHGSCEGCLYREFCLYGRRNIGSLEAQPPEEGVLSSGLYESD